VSTVPPGRHPNWCRCQGCRRDIARFESGLIGFDMIAIAAMFLIVAVIWIVTAPLRIWHVIGSDGQEHPDTATWIAYGISGAVIMGLLMFFSIRASAKGR
jgi:hypothetical protein